MYAAIDIGGTKTLVAVFDAKGKVVEQIKFPTPQDYDDFSAELAKTVANLSTKEFQAFGVAAPGRIDREHGVVVAFGNLPWTNVPILADTEKILKAPGVLENDTKLAALSEALAQKKYRKVLYVTISTGIGGGLITDGVIDTDFSSNEIGQMLMEHHGSLKRWEDFASGKAIVAHFGKKASEITDKQDWYIIARNIAIGLNAVIAALTPEVIIIGGGVGTHLPKFKDRLDEQLKIYETPMFSIPPIIQAKRPEEAVIYGCYELVKKTYAKTRR
jgi:predicted NBD/HSP70 family sugar kinase